MPFKQIRLKISIIILAVFFSNTMMAQEDSVHLVLSLEDVISIARDQSPMATMARHSFRGSYWEYRTYKAGFLPSLTVYTL